MANKRTNQMVESPCIKLCRLDDHSNCLGCGRSLSEIGAWSRATDEEKLVILKAATMRLAKAI